jgi:hypothetical protein
MNARVSLFVKTRQSPTAAKLTVCVCVCALLSGCIGNPFEDAAVDPRSPIAKEVPKLVKADAAYPTFAAVPPVPKDVRPHKQYGVAAAQIDKAAADLERATADPEAGHLDLRRRGARRRRPRPARHHRNRHRGLRPSAAQASYTASAGQALGPCGGRKFIDPWLGCLRPGDYPMPDPTSDESRTWALRGARPLQ